MATVTGFPRSDAERILSDAVENFNRTYGPTLEISSVAYDGVVTDLSQATAAMMSRMALIDQRPDGVMTVADTDDILKNADKAKLETLRRSIDLNISIGDYLASVTLKDARTGKVVETLNTIDPKGASFSGSFFLTTAIPSNLSIGVNRPNTNCKTFVLANYIFTSIPKISLEVCVRATCEGSKCVGCLLTQAKGSLGPGAELECFPQPVGGQPARGTVEGNCCIGTVQYGWATGFKSVKVKVVAGKVTIEIEGSLGRSDTGFVSVEECCGEQHAGSSTGASVPQPASGGSGQPGTGGAKPRPPKPKPANGSGVAPVTTDSTTRRTCLNTFPEALDCIDEGFDYETLKDLIKQVGAAVGERIVRVEEKLQDDRGPCPNAGIHYDLYGKSGKYHGSAFSCDCCDDLPDPEGPTMKTKFKYNG